MRPMISLLAKGAIGVIAFPTLMWAVYVGLASVVPAPRPGASGYQSGGFPIGFFAIAASFFVTRWLANRIPSSGRSGPGEVTDKVQGDV